MSKETEFRLWLIQCCLDAKKKLGLTSEDIILVLIDEMKKQLLDVFIRRNKVD